MKKAMCTICLLLIVGTGGCAAWGTYYYQPGKTLEQCSQDSLECMHELPTHAPFFYPSCMKARGYQKLSQDQLPAGIRTRQISALSLYYVTGK